MLRVKYKLWCLTALALAACGGEGHEGVFRLAGTVHGMWKGADGVALRLQADGVDRRLTVTANGPFQLPDRLSPGTSYSVTVENNPFDHVCVVDKAGNGVVTSDGADMLDVACRGPDVAITFAGHPEWVFDPTQDDQTFPGSIFVHEAVMTIDGSALASASNVGATVALGAPLSSYSFSVGDNPFQIDLTSRSGLTRSFRFTFHRGTLAQTTYGKAADAQGQRGLARAVAIDGDTIAVADIPQGLEGAVYVFVRDHGVWSQQAKISAPEFASELFGQVIALSGDTLVIGAPLRLGGGGAFVYTRVGTTWSLATTLSGFGQDAQFGAAVAIRGDHIAVGAPLDSQGGNGVNPPGAANPVLASGAAYTFHRSNGLWSPEAFIKAEASLLDKNFGAAVALADHTLAVGASAFSSEGRNQAVEVFRATDDGTAGTVWSHEQTFLGPTQIQFTGFGSVLALSADGGTLAIGAPLEIQLDSQETGAVYVTARNSISWADLQPLRSPDPTDHEQFGNSVAMVDDVLAVGAPTDFASTGAVYLFAGVGTYAPAGKVTAANADVGDQFGCAIGISSTTLVVGAPNESGAGTGVNPTTDANVASSSGAFYVFQ